MIKNRRLIIVCLFLLELCMIFISYKAYLNKPKKNEVKENITEKKSFSMYVEKDGEYIDYDESTYFPTNLKYTFNINESYCIDIKEDIVDNVLSYNDGKVTVTSNKTVYCYLYFDLEKMAPQVFTFYLGGSNNPEYVTNINTKAYLNWSDNDITHYCLTTGSDSTSCTWNEVTGTSIEVDYTLNSTDGTKTVYAYLKDAAGNISPKVTDTITLDTTAPSGIFSPTEHTIPTTNKYVKFTPTDSESGIGNNIWKYRISYDGGNTYGNWLGVDTSFNPSNTYTLSSGVSVPVLSGELMYLMSNQKYQLTFDYISTGETMFDVDFHPDDLPQIFPSATTNWQTYIWDNIISSSSNMENARLRFFNDINVPNPFTISIKNIYLYPKEEHYILIPNGENIKVQVLVTDNVGNTSIVTSGVYKLDSIIPEVTTIVNNNNTQNITITITSNESGTYCVNTSSTISDMSNCVFSGNITKDVPVTTSVFSTGGDYYVHVKDDAGNIGISSKFTVTLATPLWKYLIDNSVLGLQKTIITGDDLYRFSGTTGNTGINNYICLGTTEKCSSGSDNMYRIIGVNPTNGEIKVIKETPWNNNTEYLWHSSDSKTSWLESDLYLKTILNIYDSLPFKNLIVSNHSWNIGAYSKIFISIPSREEVIEFENDNTGIATIGILSLSDYYLAYNGTRNWDNDYDKTSNWIGGYLNGNNSKDEWTMTFKGSKAWRIRYYYGDVDLADITTGLLIRPTFFLNSNVNRISGSGTSTDPFIVG